jgi:hypothetical protein
VQAWITRQKRARACADCGRIFPPNAMEYDHRPGEQKVSALSRTFRLATAQREIAKCDLVCANCHRARTAQRAQLKRSELESQAELFAS